MTQEIYEFGEVPELGIVPQKMHAWTIRAERFGEPRTSFKQEVIEVPTLSDNEVLVYVMAAGVNYNNVWAALGIPVNVISARNKAGEPEDFHIGGSDASGVVYQVGKNVKNVKVGDEVVIHCGTWSNDCSFVKSGQDPMYSPSFRIWGYETNYGSFAQFTRVQAHQCLPKPKHLTWEAAASYMLVGATAYRMLLGWGRNSVHENDVVLIWGGAGGLGSMAIQIAKAKGAIPIAVVSDKDKFSYCESLGAKGCINRKDFDHWGMLPHWKDKVGYGEWLKGVRKFGKAIWDVLGEKRSPRIVFEHPGEATIPTSIFVCETGGLVAICAGTTGYNATVDLRYLWMRQKRLQGSHFANDEQAEGINNLVIHGSVDPCLSKAFRYSELPEAHQLMHENKHPHGNMAILIGAQDFGLGKTTQVPLQAVEHQIPPSMIRENLPPHPESEATLGFTRTPLETPEPVLFSDTTPVANLMHKGLISCKKTTSVQEITDLMLSNDIHAIVVVDNDNEPIGVVSQTDIVLASQNEGPREASRIDAASIMTPGVITCLKETPVNRAITSMTRAHIHRIVVVEKQKDKEVAVGVLSMTDIIKKMVKS